MKKILTIVLLVLGMVVPNLSQAQITYGLRVGVSSNQMVNSPLVFPVIDVSEKKALIGYDIAVFANFSISKELSFQPEIHYLQKGQKYELSYSDGSSFVQHELKNTHTVNFIEVPLLLKYSFGKKSFKPFITTGVSFGYALSQKYVGDDVWFYNNGKRIIIGGNSIESISSTEWDTDFGTNKSKDNRMDVGLVLGLGVQKNIGKNSIILDFRYVNDFTDWKEYEGTTTLSKVTSRGFVISAGVSF